MGKDVAYEEPYAAGQAAAYSCGLPSLERYRRYLQASVEWLLRSFRPRGGSAAFYWLSGRWSRPYPETTGYVIPTLLQVADRSGLPRARRCGYEAGEWLLSIQQPGGYWHGGLHPPQRGRPSVFNTAQIVRGLMALHHDSSDERWLEAAVHGAKWLASGVGRNGLWHARDYQSAKTPSYYTYAAPPMLDVWQRTQDAAIRDAAERVLGAALNRQLDNGAFREWSFSPGRPAFTHTIAYTIQGLLESARVLDDWNRYGQPTVAALELLARRAELAGGALPGAFTENWAPHGRYVCLTGNSQLALCLLMLDARDPDLRLVNAAAKLIDYVCARQALRAPLGGLRGGVLGSWPPWGRYIGLRVPNWAAKYHADALMALSDRLAAEIP